MSIPRPNVLFVMTDDQTIREMSCYGSEILQTPNMDRIAGPGYGADRLLFAYPRHFRQLGAGGFHRSAES